LQLPTCIHLQLEKSLISEWFRILLIILSLEIT
jgi:hypothetical protein